MPLGHLLYLMPHLSQVSASLQRAPFLPAANRLSPQSREDGCLDLSFKFVWHQEPTGRATSIPIPAPNHETPREGLIGLACVWINGVL